MAKFIYRMQSIYEIKIKLEDQAKQQYAAAKHKYEEELAYLGELRKRKEDYLAEGVRLREAVLDFLKIKENKAAVEKTDEYILGQQARVLAARKNMEAAQNKMNIATQERKMQEKLREKAFEEFKAELVKEEMKEVDELTSFKHGEKNRNALKEEAKKKALEKLALDVKVEN